MMGLLAVHLSDGVVTPAWWIGGGIVAALLVLLGCWRLRDEDIPRVALLSAVFFVVSLIHVPVPGGPKAHLLLVGLLGVVLGRHAALAVPLGLLLQTLLFSHGGLTMLGVNSVVMTVPALLAAILFHGLRRLPGARSHWFRASLLFASVVLFLLSAVFSAALLSTNPWTQTDHLEIARAIAVTFSPVALLAILTLGILVVGIESRHPVGPDFALGLIVGEVAVLVAVALNGLVLLVGGEADWHAVVFITVLIHLPLAVVEGLVLGFTIRFLARVQPDLIGVTDPEPATPTPVPRTLEAVTILVLLAMPASASAHGFEAEYKVTPATKLVSVECWFETGDAPKNATISVKRPGGADLISGKLDSRGCFHFHYEQPEDLVAEIDAGSGHRVRLEIPAGKLTAEPTVTGHSRGTTPWRDVVSGLAFVLALAAFVMALRNQRRLARLESRT